MFLKYCRYRSIAPALVMLLGGCMPESYTPVAQYVVPVPIALPEEAHRFQDNIEGSPRAVLKQLANSCAALKASADSQEEQITDLENQIDAVAVIATVTNSIVTARYSVRYTYSSRDLTLWKTDDPSQPWLYIGDGEGEGDFLDQSSGAPATRKAWIPIHVSPGFVGWESWHISVYRHSSAPAGAQLRATLYERVYDEGLMRASWVARSEILASAHTGYKDGWNYSGPDPEPLYRDFVIPDPEPLRSEHWVVRVQLEGNCTEGYVKFNSLQLRARESMVPR